MKKIFQDDYTKNLEKNQNTLLHYKDGKGFLAFKKQVEIIDYIWVTPDLIVSLCDDGSDEDNVYFLYNETKFKAVKVCKKSEFVKLFEGILKQLIERIENEN